MSPLVFGVSALALQATPQPAEGGIEAGRRVKAGAALALVSELQGQAPARVPGTAAHERGVAWVAESMRGVGLAEVRVERIEFEGQELFNVFGLVRGRSRERVVLAAHHDVVQGAPGAIDDGGGIAAILAAAQALLRGPPPPCDVEVAIFDGEEWGCLGSKAHVAQLRPDSIRAALAVELVGWRQDRLVVHTLPYGFAWEAIGVAPTWAPQALQRAAPPQDCQVWYGDPAFAPWYQATVRILKLRTGSDAGAYSEAGIPALMLTGSSLTNFYDGYHRATDGMAKVEGARLDDAARVVAAGAWELGALQDAPRALGVPGLSFGPRSLGPLSLALIALLGACAAALGALGARTERREAAQVALAIALVSLGLEGSVVGVLCFVPLASALLLAQALPGFRLGWLILGAIPLALELALILGASLAFGFGWRAGPLETLALATALLAAAVGMSRDAQSTSEAD